MHTTILRKVGGSIRLAVPPRRLGYAVPLDGTKTTGIVRCDQPRVIDLTAHHGRKVDTLPRPLMDEVLAKVATLFDPTGFNVH